MAHFLRRMTEKFSANTLRRIINFWPPFFGAGIKVKKISPDFRFMEVTMKLTWYNKNYVGTHFGGSIYAMTDPFPMLILLKNLGPNYIVWDKAAHITFKKPGRGTLRAIFTIAESDIDNIRAQADQFGKHIFDQTVDVIDQEENVIATVVKTLYVRRKEIATTKQ